MDKDYTHISVVLDRSGSMSPIRQDVIGGLNTFINSQKEQKGKCTFTLAQFDHIYEINYNTVPISEVKDLTNETYLPRGSTALLDAIGRTINETGTRLSAMKESQKPQKILFVIQTDGYENASLEFTQDQIATMIKEQKEKYNWEFIFLGADQNAIAVASKFNIDQNKSLTFAKSSYGTMSMYNAVSSMASGYRCAVGDQSVSMRGFTKEEQDLQDKEGAFKSK